ncbi:putative T7SS-secreted protein [Streptomyces sp. NPDC059002]|uniref:putative T7SS-secreted protein n=1 Tax=Streptomyces sp. NPDC059002 TaxID=3346690 RepID=UPI0036973A16
MTARPTDWTPLYDSDPVPGDPYEVARLGKKLRGMADEIDKQARNIKALASVEHWDSEAGRAFHETAGDTSKRLKDAYDRYDEAAEALGTKVDEGGGKSNEYASELHRAQRMADKALEEFRAVEPEQKAARAALDKTKGTVPSSQEDSVDRTKQQKKLDDATSVMAKHRQTIMNAVEIRDDAASAAAKKIKRIIHHDGVRDPGGFMNWLADHADWFSAAATVLAVVALVAAVVLTGGIAAIIVGLAAALSATALAGRLYDVFARGGKFDWVKITIDVLGIIPGVGALKGLAVGAKGLTRLGAAQATAWRMFTNGIAVKSINKGVSLTSKLLTGKLAAKVPGLTTIGSKVPGAGFLPENVTRVIKGAALTNLGVQSAIKLNRILDGGDDQAPKHVTPDAGPGARPHPTPGPSAPPSAPGTPSPSPRPSPTSAPFHGALAPAG